jgi:membrane fusion protein (multidrug efflux system)
LIGIVAVALAGCGPSNSGSSQPASPPLSVKTDSAKRGEIARSITLPTFRILPLQQATLYAKVSGYLKTLSVDKGDTVTEGQLIGEIEVPELIADEAQYRADSEVAHTNYLRMAGAREKSPDLVVPETVDNLRQAWEVASAKLQRAQTLLQYSRLMAPFSGVVTARYVDPGSYIPAATAGASPQSAAVLTLMDFSRVRIQVFVPELEVPFISNGVPVQITVEALPGKVLSGSVTRFANALDETTKTMLAEIELPNMTGTVRPGMYASVRLELERKHDALIVPVSTLLVEKAGSSVFTVADGKAKKIPVQTGFNDGTNVEILNGIQPAEKVIVIGKQTLSDGQPVAVEGAK